MPRPPPPRAITGCCTCTPRPTPRQRPPSSSHHPPHSLTSSSSHTTSSSPCSSSSHPPHSQPFTTSSTQPAQPAPSSPAPVLDFLYPGFGFFSRSLPPIVLIDRSSRSSQSSSSTSSSASIVGPPPPPPVPISTHDSPHYRSQEGRKLLSSSSSSSTSSNLLLPTGGLFSQQYRTKTSWRNVNLGNCVCGRVRETCLRCRGKSTDTRERISPVVVSGMDERIEYKGSNTSAAPSTSSTPNLFDPAILDTPEPTTRSSDPAPSTSTVPDPLTSFRTFFSHLSKTLPSSRTSSSSILPAPSPSTSSPTSTRRRLHRKRSNLSTSPLSLVETLSTHLSDPKVWNELGYYEKLDSIRLFVRITKLLPHNPPLGPLLEPTTSSTSTERDGELLRTKAGERIQYFLDRLENARGSGEQNELSEAGLWIDSFALRGIVETIPAPLRTTSEEISGKFEKSIRTVFGGWEDSIRGKGKGKEEKTKIQAVRTGLASLFESWLMRGNRRREGGELAFKLVYEFELDSIFETTTTSLEGETDDARAIASRKRQELGYNDLLRRQYGLLLGRLGPSPVEWLEAAEEERGERFVAKGLHLVEYLSSSGSAGEARKVWERVEEARVTLEEQRRGEEGAELVQSTEEDRLKSLTKLVDGLIMEGFYEDANALTKELEDLAKQVGTRDETLALVSYRTLAKLASNQGRPEILDRLLKKIDTLTHRTSTSTSLLESFARRIRSKSARSDAQSVRSLFAEIQESTEWTQATKEDQARLWSQVILAQTRINDVEAAIESLRSLVAHGLRPPLSAVNSILFGFARRGEVTTVDALFQQLARGGFDRIRPDTGSWNALVLARTTVRDPSAASRVIAEMRERGGVTPNRQTWTTLMSGLVDGAQWKQTFEVYRFLEQHPSIDMRPDTAATNVVLKACVLTATPARLVIALFRQLLARGFRPNMMTYTLVLQSLTTAGLMDLAEELYLMMDRPSTPDSPALPASMTPVRPDQFIFSTLIAGYLKGDEKAKARACLAEMRRRGIEPSSITLAIVVGSRLDARSTPRKVKMMISEARNLLKEGETGLASMRKTQSTRKDRKLATGDEAVAIFAPIFRSAAKQGLGPAALELLEEIQSRRKRDEVPVELYTMLMDAFRGVEDGEGSANNVKTVWDRLYESIAERFMTLRTPSSTPLPEEFTSHVLTTSQLDLRVDPAQASILSVPLTIFLESMARAERHHIFGITWRALARQGFSFDASNWNVLALYFARDLQLERAFWITENILCRPHDETVPSPSPSDFEADFSHVTRSSAIARNPSRLSTLRENERDQHRKVPLDVTSLLSTPSSESSPANPSRADLDVAKVFGNALKLRQATFWHPYGSVLEALESALEVLTMTEDVEVGPDADTSAAELKEKLVRNHPRTMRAINLWRSRGERKDRERERYLSVQGRSL